MALKPEVIGDVEQGDPGSDQKDAVFDTPEERAAWEAMEADGRAAPPAVEVEEPAPEPAPEAPEGTPAPVKAEGDEPDGDDGDEPPEGAPAVDPKTGRAPQKQVNWNKHQRELKKREDKIAAAETRSRQLELDGAKLAERLAILNEALTAPVPVTPEAPKPNPMEEADIDAAVDPLGAIAQANRRVAYLNSALAETRESSQAFTETTQATLEDQRMVSDFQRDAEAYARTPEGQHFPAAYQFLKDSRLTELAISLFDKDPRDPNQQFTQAEITKLVTDFNAEEKWVVGNARKAGKSPSEAIMKLAKGRGFAPQAAPAPALVAPVVPAKNGNGAPPAPSPSAVAKIKEEAAGAAASRSLSDGGGAPPAEALTPERLVKMTDAEFDKYMETIPKEHLDAIMGRPAAGRA